jgi:hypoxanthine phosphoribosyltransferase
MALLVVMYAISRGGLLVVPILEHFWHRQKRKDWWENASQMVVMKFE